MFWLVVLLLSVLAVVLVIVGAEVAMGRLIATLFKDPKP